MNFLDLAVGWMRQKKLTPAQLKAFRASVSRAKRDGRLPKSIDARTVKPSDKIGRRRVDTVLDSGEYVKKVESNYRLKATHLKIKKSDILDILKAKGNERIMLLDELAHRYDKMKAPGDYWAFNVGGTDSLHTYTSLYQLFAKLSNYSPSRAIRAGYSRGSDKFKALSRNPFLADQQLLDKLYLMRWTKSPNAYIKQREIKKAKPRVKATKKVKVTKPRTKTTKKVKVTKPRVKATKKVKGKKKR